MRNERVNPKSQLSVSSATVALPQHRPSTIPIIIAVGGVYHCREPLNAFDTLMALLSCKTQYRFIPAGLSRFVGRSIEKRRTNFTRWPLRECRKSTTCRQRTGTALLPRVLAGVLDSQHVCRSSRTIAAHPKTWTKTTFYESG